MNQQKIGEFLKTLRKEKGLTQEQLAEYFMVTNRTVSRWETGNNMPDISILIELSSFFDVDIYEIIEGERKITNENNYDKTVLKIAEYSKEDKQKITKRMHVLFIVGLLSIIVYTFLLFTDNTDNFIGGLCLGITTGMMIVGVIMTSKYSTKIQEFKLRILKHIQ